MKEQKSKHLVGYCINFFNNVATNAKGSNTSTIVERVLPHTSIYLRVCTIYNIYAGSGGHRHAKR